MQKKTIGIIIITVASILFIGIIYIFFASDYLSSPSNGDGAPDPGQEQAETSPKVVVPSGGAGGAKEPAKEYEIDIRTGSPDQTGERSDKKDLERIASSFAERFGTYSNQSGYGNLNSLKLVMTGSMKAWTDKYISEQKKNGADTSIYYGVTTKAVGTEVVEYDDETGKAVIRISTRRREATGAMSNYANPYTQDIRIEFAKENGAWKVSGAYWQ